MSFYGSVINYLAKAFNKIKINNEIIQANSYDDQLEIQSDEWINLKSNINNNSIHIMHSSAQIPTSEQPCSILIGTVNPDSENGIKLEGDITNGESLIISLPTFDDKGHQAGSQTYHLKLLTDKLKQDILGEGKISEAFDTLQEIATWIQQEGIDATELTKEIVKIQVQLQKYETSESVSRKIEEAISQMELLINELNVAPSDIPNRYVSDISQVGGQIKPVYTDLPFDYPDTINLKYNEETGNLSFPTYFRTHMVGETSNTVYDDE